MSEPIISFEAFSFQYLSQTEPTLHSLDVTIQKGEKVVVVGPSGSGKSTFAACINGLVPNQYEGTITGRAVIDGKNLAETSLVDLSFSTGTVLQDTDGQFIGLSVAEDIAFSLENDAVPTGEMHDRVAKWAEQVDLAKHLAKRPQDLSGGQKQRVSMAGVLIDEAPILLFDEPLANLDPAAGKEAIELIDSIHQTTQATVLIIEHRLEDVLTCPVDRILVFNEGRIVADMPPADLLKTTILADNGIREPLYVTAMKYAEVDLDQVTHLDQLSQLAGNEVSAKLNDWLARQSQQILPTNQKPLLGLQQVTYRYHPNEPYVLKDVSTILHQGERISIVGKNGAGKSTLFKAICGFIPAQGEFLWEGQSITDESIKQRAEKIGYVMQNPNQMISKKMIADEVALGLVLRGVPEAEIQERVEAVLHTCGLYPFRNWPIAALSYGQKKRVTIASILVLEPELIILDEPTAGQDYRNYSEMMAFVEQLSQTGKTIVMITHDMHLMLEYSDRVLVMSEGQLVADTTPIELLTSPELVSKASLKETSLFTLASKFGLVDPVLFTQTFIQYDREVRTHA